MISIIILARVRPHCARSRRTDRRLPGAGDGEENAMFKQLGPRPIRARLKSALRKVVPGGTSASTVRLGERASIKDSLALLERNSAALAERVIELSARLSELQPR